MKNTVQKVHVTLSSGFRECLRNGLADHRPIAHKSHIGGVGETYPVLSTFSIAMKLGAC